MEDAMGKDLQYLYSPVEPTRQIAHRKIILVSLSLVSVVILRKFLLSTVYVQCLLGVTLIGLQLVLSSRPELLANLGLYTSKDQPFDLPKHCAHISPLSSASFVDRQNTLARTLHDVGAAAYIAEPGASAAFFANISSSHWGLSERPLLLIITPEADAGGDVRAKVTVLTPAFEASRAKTLPVPSAFDIEYPSWAEDADPYAVAVSAIPQLHKGTVFVDGSLRTFITDGLQHAAHGSSVVSAPIEVRRLRERKSKEELEILKCANEVSDMSYSSSRLSLEGLIRKILGDSSSIASCTRENAHWYTGV